MPFLTLNGHTFRVADNTAKRKVNRKGRRTRAYRGQMRDGTRGQRRQFSMQACFVDFDEAETIIHTINGEGHVVTFTRGWEAATGLQPEVGRLEGTYFDRSQSPFSSPFEQGCLVFEGDGDPVLRYDAQLCDEYTIHWWQRVDAGDWQVCTFRDDALGYVDGVVDDDLFADTASATGGNCRLYVTEGRLGISGRAADPTRLHHLAILPWRASVSQIETWHAATKPWGHLPLLRAEGDMLLTDHEFFFGEVDNVEFVQHGRNVDGLGWVNNAQLVDFTLYEYQPGFVSA